MHMISLLHRISRTAAAAALVALAAGAAGCAGTPAASAGASTSNNANPTVGGAPMYASRNIVQNAVNSPIHTTLVAAVKAGGLVDTLSSPGPFTVFAPTNAAFDALPAGTVDTLLKPENKPKLNAVLTYHVVPGRIMAADLITAINASGGSYYFKTVQGTQLVAYLRGDQVLIRDTTGGDAVVTTADVRQSNGVIHVVDKVLLPTG